MKIQKPKLDTKALQIDKAQSKIILVIVVATIVTIFCLVSSRALLSQALYQRRVVNARNQSAKSLQTSINNANTLKTQYTDVFLGHGPQNVIGGLNENTEVVNGVTEDTAPPKGDNARIVLHALPTSYDFPALLTSISQILSNNHINGASIGGTDDAVNVKSDPSGNPAPSNIDLTISGTGTYGSVVTLINDFQRSIRPMDITHLSLAGNESSLSVTLSLTTYYQTAKTLTITGKGIK